LAGYVPVNPDAFTCNIMKPISILAIFFFLCSGCNKTEVPDDDNTPVTSSLSAEDVTLTRDSRKTTTFRFVIDVNPVNTNEIKVNYTTKNGTAVSGTDYTAVSGTLTIPAKQYTGYIDVVVSADSLRQDDQTFTLEFSSPVNATLSDTNATGTIQNTGTYLPVDDSGYTSASAYEGMTLVWSDEFNPKTLNSDNWTYETGGGGWGNNELEYYTSSSKNLFLSGGYLIIEARKETSGSYEYTSARIKTQNKKTFNGGRIDIRAKLPKGQGLWPALWMLGNNISETGYGWPACGEIDIMELLGSDVRRVYSTVHWGVYGGSHYYIGGNHTLSTGDFSGSFHVFSLDWNDSRMEFLVDDVLYYTATKAEIGTDYPFDKPFFFVMNVAVGGYWPGNPDSSTIFPQRMIVDYVRVYQ
jgi:beta-glucanase (GH16 family)